MKESGLVGIGYVTEVVVDAKDKHEAATKALALADRQGLKIKRVVNILPMIPFKLWLRIHWEMIRDSFKRVFQIK